MEDPQETYPATSSDTTPATTSTPPSHLEAAAAAGAAAITETTTTLATATAPSTSFENVNDTVNDDNLLLERAISSSCWAENLMCATKKKKTRVAFHPLRSTITHDAEKITPGESMVYVRPRNGETMDSDCTNAVTFAFATIRAASEIMNSIASISLVQYSMYSKRNLIPLFLSDSKHNNYGGKTTKRSILKKCFSKSQAVVRGLIEELAERKVEAAKAFANAVREKSVVNAALAAWSAGNAANLQHLLHFLMLKYGPQKMYDAAGLYRTSGTPRTGNDNNLTSTEYLEEIKRRHRGRLDFDSAPFTFNTALSRVFKEFKESVDAKAENGAPLYGAVRQRRRNGIDYLSDVLYDAGMLAPRDEGSVAEYVLADSEGSDISSSRIALDFENFRGGIKRRADTKTDDLRNTLAQSIADSAIDPSKVTSSADLNRRDLEWSMHMTQLFSQAFLETVSSLLSCSFEVKNPFSEEGFEKIGNLLRRRVGGRSVDMDPSVLADEYLLLVGNFQIPFHGSDPLDVVEGRRVCPNTPVLTIVTRYKTKDNKIATDIEFRDRLKVEDVTLNEAFKNTFEIRHESRSEPTDSEAPRRPTVNGCLPVIRGPLTFKRNEDVDDTVSGLASDWYISIGVQYSIGKVGAAILAGFQRSIAAATSLTSADGKEGTPKSEDRSLKMAMRRNADRCTRLSHLLGQTVSQWGHREHNSTLDSFWSSSAAVRSKVVQDALSRSQIISARRLLDGKCRVDDDFGEAEKIFRRTFFDTVSRAPSSDLYDGSKVDNYSDYSSLSSTKYDQWFKNDATGIAKRSWLDYASAINNLTKYERRIFDVDGLFSAIGKFKFPLVCQWKRHHKAAYKKRVLCNLKAADSIINGLTRMTLQSALNGTDNFLYRTEFTPVGSAGDGWNLEEETHGEQLEPSRMDALNAAANLGKGRLDVISIPVSLSRGSVYGLRPRVTCVNIPAVILSHLISDKKILDSLCGGSINLKKAIKEFVQIISGNSSSCSGSGGSAGRNRISSIFTDGQYTIMLLRYVWFNVAVISLTDSNIKMPVNVCDKGLGDALYEDYLAIRSLVNNYNSDLRDFSVEAVVDHYSRREKSSTPEEEKTLINDKKELTEIVKGVTDVLTTFIDKADGTLADSSNTSGAIKEIGNTTDVKNATVSVSDVSKYVNVENSLQFLTFLKDIGQMNSNMKDSLTLLIRGGSLTDGQLDNYSSLDVVRIFKDQLMENVSESDFEKVLGQSQSVTVDASSDEKLVTALAEGIRAKYFKISEPSIEAEIEAQIQEATLSLINKINVPGFMSPFTAVRVVEALTSDGPQSNKNTHLGILKDEVIPLLLEVLQDNSSDSHTLKVEMGKVGEFAQNLLLVCFVCLHSKAGRYVIEPTIKEFSRLLIAVLAEASLSLSRLQSSFYPLPPSFFSLTGAFKPSKDLFDQMIKDYVSEIVKHLSSATSSASEQQYCDDSLDASVIFKAGENYNADRTPVGQQQQQQQQQQQSSTLSSPIDINLVNPASVWSSSALPHFDTAVVPKLHSGITRDQILRLSSYYQGMHKISSGSSSSECQPETWDRDLPGNLAGDFFNLREFSDNSRSFNSALDSLLSSPAEICDLVSREIVRTSNDVVHNIGSSANRSKLQNMLQIGLAAVKPLSSYSPSPSETSIEETISFLSKNVTGLPEGHATAKEIIRTWNVMSVANYADDAVLENVKNKSSDVVRAPLEALSAFKTNFLKATKSLYELAAICSIMSKNEEAKTASRKIMETIEDTSPVVRDVGISRIAGLVSAVASPSQYKRFLQMVSSYRNQLVRTADAYASASFKSGDALKAVYDGLLVPTRDDDYLSSDFSTLQDKFWKKVLNKCFETGDHLLFADRMAPTYSSSFYSPITHARIYGSRLNTYAAISSNVNRQKVFVDSTDETRRASIEKNMERIENYVKEIASEDKFLKMIQAQRRYSKFSSIIANSIHESGIGDRSVVCDGMSFHERKKTPRQKSDSILSSLMHELASLLHATRRKNNTKLAVQFALAGHIIVAKGVDSDDKVKKSSSSSLRETYENLLSAAGVADYACVSAESLCLRLKPSDVKMFLGGAILQRGLFVTFLLNSIIFSRMSKTITMEQLDNQTKSNLASLVEFCQTLSRAFEARYARRVTNKKILAGKYFATEEAKIDASFLHALYSAHDGLVRNTGPYKTGLFNNVRFPTASVAENFMRSAQSSVRGPRPKRNSSLKDVLEAPSVIHKSFMTSFPEKAAATRQVKLAGRHLLSSNKMEVLYDRETLNRMRSSHGFCFVDDDDYFKYMECSDEDDRMSDSRSFSSSSSSSSSSENDWDAVSDDSDEEEGEGYSYDALDRLNAVAAPLSAIYGCGDADDAYSKGDGRNTAMDAFLRDVGEADYDDEDNDGDDEEDYFYRHTMGPRHKINNKRRLERIQYGPGFLSHAFLLDHPEKTRAFLTSEKKFKTGSGHSSYFDLFNEDGIFFSEEYDSGSEDGDASRHRVAGFKRRKPSNQCAFVKRVMRAFVPTKISLIDGKVSLITPVETDSVSGFFNRYQTLNKKEREDFLQKKLSVSEERREGPYGLPGNVSSSQLRRSLIKTFAYVSRIQRANSQKIYDAIGNSADADNDPSTVLSKSVFFSEELESIIEKRNVLLRDLTYVSTSLFTSLTDQEGGIVGVTRSARNIVNRRINEVPGYLGVPLHNLSRCLRQKRNEGENEGGEEREEEEEEYHDSVSREEEGEEEGEEEEEVGIDIKTLLSITDKTHLDWMTAAALTFARSFNVTTFHAVDSTLKTTLALEDMYAAFSNLVSSSDKQKLPVKSTLLDSIFNARMSHLESVLGLVYPTAFINHEMPTDPEQRKSFQASSLTILRGVNCKQLTDRDIGDTAGLLTYLTSSDFAGRGGERGGLSLYRMSITDALSCESTENRLKGAISLEVGKRETIKNSVFSRRSKDLVEYCSRKSISLENAVGPIARFAPNGVDTKKLLGMSEPPTTNVENDPATIRLQNAECGPRAYGHFIVASAMGNLYGCIEEVASLAKKFSESKAVSEITANHGDTVRDIAKKVLTKMKNKRNKSLRTPFGDTVISQATNFPAFSEAIVLRAREMRNSIATIVVDLSKKYALSSQVVDDKAFLRTLETAAVLANTKMTLRGIENRLAAAETQLRQFEHIANDGLSESRAVIASVAQVMNAMDSSVQGGRFSVSELLKDNNGLLKFIAGKELNNIREAKRQVKAAIEGASQLHASILEILMAPLSSSEKEGSCFGSGSGLDDGGPLSRQFGMPMVDKGCGTIKKHPETNLWLKTDEDCNTGRTEVERKGGSEVICSSFLLPLMENNRNEAIRSRLHSMCFGKYSVSDIFALDHSDSKTIDKLIEKLTDALNSRESPTATSVTPLYSDFTSEEDKRKSDTCSFSSASLAAKTIPYIPIIFENRQEENFLDAKQNCNAGSGGGSSSSNSNNNNNSDQTEKALCHLETQEANDLSNVLSIATKHKFASHNQAATVAIFNGSQRAESIFPETEWKNNEIFSAVMSKMPFAVTAAVQADSSSATSMQLPPSSFKIMGKDDNNGGTPVATKLRDHALKVASSLFSSPEYKDLIESQRKIKFAVDQLNSIQGDSFFTYSARPEINQRAMNALSQSQSAKDRALELFERVLKEMEAHTPDPSISVISLPLNVTPSSSSFKSGESKPAFSTTPAVTDYFNYAFNKINKVFSENVLADTLEKDTMVKNMAEDDSGVRVPLLLTFAQFTSLLREMVRSISSYFELVQSLKQKISSDASQAISHSFKEIKKEMDSDENYLNPAIDESTAMYSKEADAITTALKVLKTKMTELELQNERTYQSLAALAERIETGENAGIVNDILKYGNMAENNKQLLQSLKDFAKDNSGVVFTPRSSSSLLKFNDNQRGKLRQEYRQSSLANSIKVINDTISNIQKGQESLTTDYGEALSDFPSSSTIDYNNLTMKSAEEKQRARLASVEKFIKSIADRIKKLKGRLKDSYTESSEVAVKRHKIESMFRQQIQDRYQDTKKNMDIAETAVQLAIVRDLDKSQFLINLTGKLDRLLQRVEKNVSRPQISHVSSSLSLSSSSSSSSFSNKPSSDSSSSSFIEGMKHIQKSFCFMAPFHETIRRMGVFFKKYGRGPLKNDRGVSTSDADLQLMTIVDLSTNVLNSASGSKYPDAVPSSVVPGLCQFCAMAVTNMHEAFHESSHSFNFEEKKSRQRLAEMLNAAICNPDKSPRVRHDVLAMLEGNNGYVKEFRFVQRQKVACITPVNTLLGDNFSGDITPNTVLLPTSELINCPGLDADKFRSIVHRSVDDTVADAPKSSASIVETLARTAPNAENLFFPFKDQKRHFNSVSDAIITNMSSEAASQLNTTCDQNLVRRDNGFPIFVGRRPGKSRVTETCNSLVTRGGMPGCADDDESRYIDVGAKYLVAPGSLLNANKEETLRMNRISDINNVRHYGTDVHVAGANSAWRMSQVIKAASTGSENEAAARKLLLLGSVSAVSAQKSVKYANDPTAMLNTSTAVQSLVNEAFPSPASMAAHAGAAEHAFATQLAYRQRLFPGSGKDGSYYDSVISSSSMGACPMDVLGMIRRYGDSFDEVFGRSDEIKPGNDSISNVNNCNSILKKSISNVPLLSTPHGAFEEASSAVKNRMSPLYSNNDREDSVNRLSVMAMTDTVVDTLSAMSSLVGRYRHNVLSPHLLSLAARHGGACDSDKSVGGAKDILQSMSKISKDASLLSSMKDYSDENDCISISSIYPLLSSSSSSSSSSFYRHHRQLSPARESSSAGDAAAAERVLGAILDGAREASARLTRLGVGKGGAGRPEVNALYSNAMTSILRLNEAEIARDITDVETKLEKRQLKAAFDELKKTMLVSTDGSLGGASDGSPFSSLVAKSNVASGRLMVGLGSSNVVNAVDEFNTTPLLVRHFLLDSNKSPVPVAKEVKGILAQPKAVTARALLSESCPLLTELCLFNTRDTQPERAVDRLVTSAYLVKQAKRFDGVDPLFPAAITGTAHLMLSSMDSSRSRFLNNIKLHVNDTTSFLKNVERYERFLGRYGDSYAMTHKQNCNCPFALHHDFRSSADEELVPSFCYSRPEVTVEEIRATPYQANKLLNDKHYVMSVTKIDTRVTGSSLLKKVSEWTEMRTNACFSGVFEPSRLALSNSGMTTAGVNLDVIVRPNNARNVMGMLECHRHHVCSVDAKSTVAAAMPAVFQSTSMEDPGNVSELIQNALPHNRYIQKSIMNTQTVIFANVLEQMVADLGKVILNELAHVLTVSVSDSIYDETKAMMDDLQRGPAKDKNRASYLMEEEEEEEEDNYGIENGNACPNNILTAPLAGASAKLVTENMRDDIYRNLISVRDAEMENVPFASTANGVLAYDFLLSKDASSREKNAEKGAAKAVANSPEWSVFRRQLARIFESISERVSENDLRSIIEDVQAKIIDEAPQRSSTKQRAFAGAVRREFNKILSFLQILRNNITPALQDPGSPLSEKMAIYLSLLSTKSRLENLLQYGLSNSSSVDLSHLKPVNGSNGCKNIEDTFMYRNVHPVLIMALPENFTALLQQEQSDAELAVENRRALTTFLNHPNTASMAAGARASVGAGGGNPMGLYVSSHVLHESTVTTSNPVADAESNFSFHSSVTGEPVMVVNPFKESSKLKLFEETALLEKDFSYLQVSMPTEFSGLVTNTGIRGANKSSDTFKFTRRDDTVVYLRKVASSVLCSDASSNLLDIFSRADVILKDVNVRFSFMPEIIEAIAGLKELSPADVIRDMFSKGELSSSDYKKASIDAKTGDVIIKNGTFPDVRALWERSGNNGVGGGGGGTRSDYDNNDNNGSSIGAPRSYWGEENKTKLHARFLPSFMISNPLAFASVSGIPLTSEGFALTEEKRKKAAGISSGSRSETFGSGCVGSGTLRAVANSRLVSDLEPLRKGWENIAKLQEVFSKTAANLKRAIENDKKSTLSPATRRFAEKLAENHRTLKRCKEILQTQTALLVATGDLVTGGYAGDPFVAMVAPVRSETMGIIGAISAPVRGMNHLLRRDGVAAVNAALRAKLSLSSSNGRLIPEHGVVHKSSRELLSDADSICSLYSENQSKDEDGSLTKIAAALGLEGERGGGGGGGVTTMRAPQAIGNSGLLSGYGEDRFDTAKKQGIMHLLVSNSELSRNVADALFFTSGKNSISPLTPCAALMGDKDIFGKKYEAAVDGGNNVETIYKLFNSRKVQ